jgi:hypothetical protein
MGFGWALFCPTVFNMPDIRLVRAVYANGGMCQNFRKINKEKTKKSE